MIQTALTNIPKGTGKIRQGAQRAQDNGVCDQHSPAVLCTWGFVLVLRGYFRTSYVHLSLYTMDM